MEGALMNGPDAVIIQICNAWVGNCSNISNMQCLRGHLNVIYSNNIEVMFKNLKYIRYRCGKLFKLFKYAMFMWDFV